MRRLILRSFQSPGDILMLTAAVRDLHLAAPGKFQTDVRTSVPALWENNPHLTRLHESEAGVECLDMHYPLVHQSNQRPYHFLHGFVQYLEEKLTLRIPVTRFAADVHLSPDERQAALPGGDVPNDFWIIIAGGKFDFTAKWWDPADYQAVVDHFKNRLTFVQCGEANHWHPVRVTGNLYDEGLGGGDNNLTQNTQYVDSSTSRDTAFLYDWRDRLTDIDGEVDFYEQRCYDNLDRVLKIDRRDTTASGVLVARSLTYYDDRGHVYQSVRFGVDPATGAVGNALTDNNWFDAAGNLLKSLPAGSQLFAKFVYDGVGHVTVRYSGYNLTDSSYANASDVSTDTILEQVEFSLDDASNLIMTATRLRYHNATGVGPLGSPSSAQPLARVSYMANWQDGIGRAIAVADYSTNGGSTFVRPDLIPPSSDT